VPLLKIILEIPLSFCDKKTYWEIKDEVKLA
jgi:hypothetical protein